MPSQICHDIQETKFEYFGLFLIDYCPLNKLMPHHLILKTVVPKNLPQVSENSSRKEYGIYLFNQYLNRDITFIIASLKKALQKQNLTIQSYT